MFLNSVGDIGLLPRVLDAASRFARVPDDHALTALLEARRMSSLFGLPA